MKSETPLIDATIMFMREFKILASAESMDGLRRMLKPEQLEQFGDPITPDFVYDAMQKLSSFQNMRVGYARNKPTKN